MLFIIGFIWILIASSSLLVGPLVGINRAALRAQSAALVLDHRLTLTNLLAQIIHAIAFVGFLFPLCHPFWGLVVAIIFLAI